MRIFYLSSKLPYEEWLGKSFLLFSFFFLFLFHAANAQIQVKDIHGSNGSSPDKMVELNNVLYFSADDGANGAELWKSDGTNAGTSLVYDIRPGGVGSGIDDMVEMGGKIFFAANDGSNGTELWVHDGTNTTMLKDINTSGSSSPDQLTVINGKIYFAASSSTSVGKELWMSDGTPAGTVMVKDINSGSGSSEPTNFYGFNSKVYFSAYDPTNGRELWETDGTGVGTSLVQNINMVSLSSYPADFFEFNSKLFFAAEDVVNGREVWSVDLAGSATLFKNIYSGSSGSWPSEFFAFNSELYFTATNLDPWNTEIWKSDGTSGGTVAIEYNPSTANGVFPSNYVVMGSYFYFVASRYNSHGYELHKSDGTFAGTTTVKNINEVTSASSDITSLHVFDGRLYFGADDDTHGKELWMSDGTTAGTVMLRDVNDDGSSPGPDSNPEFISMVNNILFFRADNGTDGKELMQVGNCAITDVPLATDEGIYQSYFEKTEGPWTHYCDCQNNLILSLNKGGTGADIPTTGVSVKIGATDASYYDETCDCFITNTEGAVVFNRTWDVIPTTQPTSDVGVRFYFTNDEYNAVNSELTGNGATALGNVNDMSFYKITNSGLGSHPEIVNIPAGDALVLLNGSPSTTTWESGTFGSDHYAEYLVSSFSGGGGGGGSGGSPLPVEMLSFKGRPQGGNVYLEWATASELDNSGFFIERSKDGEYWEKIDFVESKGGDSAPNLYEYVDTDPFVGVSYYRLIQRDLDGSEEYSTIVQISMEALIMSEISPNPVLEQSSVFLDVHLERDQDVEVLLIDSNGSVAKQERIRIDGGVHRLEIGLQDLSRGLYHLRLTINKEAYHRNFVIESIK